MYSLIRSIAKPRGNAGRWTELDAGGMRLCDLYSNYDKVYLGVQDAFMPSEEKFDLEKIRKDYVNSILTVQDWLTLNGNKTLETEGALPVIKTRQVRFYDAVRSAYKIEPVAANARPDSVFPESEKTWLYLTHPNVDFREFGKYGLVSVNGYYHFVDAAPDGAWVVDGMKTARQCNENILGITSFFEVGEIKTFPITKEMLTPLYEKKSLQDKMCIDLGEDVTNKTVGIVIAGYLHLLDPRVLFMLNERVACLNLRQLPLVERYLESYQDIDYSSLNLDIDLEHPEHIGIDDFLSDDAILGLLTLSQSFIVLIDNPDVYIEQESADIRPGVGTILSKNHPDCLLKIGYGKIAEYWKTWELDMWAVKVRDLQKSNYMLHTTLYGDWVTVNDIRNPHRRVTPTAVWFRISSDI